MDQNLIKRGAERGLLMGLVFTLMFVAWIKSASAAWSLLLMVLFVFVPVIEYRLLNHSMTKASGSLRLSALWLEGILMFVGGALLLMVPVYAFFRWIDPTFTYRMLNMFVDMYGSDANMAQYVDVAKRMIDLKMLPKPTDVALSLFWTIAFTGSMLSLVVAALVSLKNKIKR